MKSDEKDVIEQIDFMKYKIAEELKKGKDIVIKYTPKGIKVQSSTVNTLTKS